MDPNKLLEEIREILGKEYYVDCTEESREKDFNSLTPRNQMLLDDGDRLSGLVQDLDSWLSRGGFLPKAWERKKANE
jgi:hypothetical protein